MEHLNKQPRSFLKTLDAAERVVTRFYRLLLFVIIAAVFAVIGLVIVHRPWGAGNQGEWFYFSVAVLFVLAWAVGQLVATDRRRRKRSVPLAMESRPQAAMRTWTFRFGSPPHKRNKRAVVQTHNDDSQSAMRTVASFSQTFLT
jgi:hypothetical protein